MSLQPLDAVCCLCINASARYPILLKLSVQVAATPQLPLLSRPQSLLSLLLLLLLLAAPALCRISYAFTHVGPLVGVIQDGQRLAAAWAIRQQVIQLVVVDLKV